MHHLPTVMLAAWWPGHGRMRDPGSGGKEWKKKSCSLIFQAGCAFPSPPSQLQEVGAGKGLGLLALP